MLLSNLISLISEQCNIANQDILNILKVNKIRIEQRLLLEKPDVIAVTTNKEVKNKKSILEKGTNINTNINTINNTINNTNIDTNIITNIVKENPIEENIVKENPIKENPIKENIVKENIVKENIVKDSKPARGRGRPRKNTIMKEEEETICVEVEEVTIEGVSYYVTAEKVILSKGLEIEGIMREGRLVRSEK